MTLTNKNKIIIAIVYTICCVAAGNLLGPQKYKLQKEVVKSETDTENKNEQVKTDKNRDKHTEKTVVEKVNVDGSKEVTTKIVTDDKASAVSTTNDKISDTTVKAEADKTVKEVERGGSKTHISALAGLNVLSPADGLAYGASISHDILGPFSIGLFGLTNGTAGASVGISF